MTRPTFNHPVFEQLYARDYFIDDAVLREILALGPEVAVPELLKITTATLDDESTGEDWFDVFYFLHALYLLHDLRAPEALDVYRRLLLFNSETTDFWFGYELFEEVPDMLARASQTRLPELLAMLEDQKMLLQHRLVVSEAISRLVTAQPAHRPAISVFLQGYLRHIIAHADQAAQLFPTDIDSYGYDSADYLAGLLLDVQQAGLRELEPEVRALHRLGVVDEFMAGGEDRINFDRSSSPQPLLDIFTRYRQLRGISDNYSPFHPDAANLARRRAEQEAKRVRDQRAIATQQLKSEPPKTGRNDPCFCGSGKKYKKCCMA